MGESPEISFPDVNVWFSLCLESSETHPIAVQWLRRSQLRQIVFCRLTQLSVLRLLTQPSATGSFVHTQRGAWQRIDNLYRETGATFLPEPAPLETILRTLSSRDQISPKLWTDDYLAAFAIVSGLTLVTFDRALAARVPSATLLTR